MCLAKATQSTPCHQLSSPPGPEQSSSCRAGGPKTFLLGPVADTAAPAHFTVLHDGVVRRGLAWPGGVGMGRGGRG